MMAGQRNNSEGSDKLVSNNSYCNTLKCVAFPLKSKAEIAVGLLNHPFLDLRWLSLRSLQFLSRWELTSWPWKWAARIGLCEKPMAMGSDFTVPEVLQACLFWYVMASNFTCYCIIFYSRERQHICWFTPQIPKMMGAGVRPGAEPRSWNTVQVSGLCGRNTVAGALTSDPQGLHQQEAESEAGAEHWARYSDVAHRQLLVF